MTKGVEGRSEKEVTSGTLVTDEVPDFTISPFAANSDMIMIAEDHSDDSCRQVLSVSGAQRTINKTW